MANFDINTYLANRERSRQTNNKMQEVEVASAEKIQQLQSITTPKVAFDHPDLHRTSIGQDVQDLGLSFLQGTAWLPKIPTMLYEKATTGNFYGPLTQNITELSDEAEKLKSALSQAKGKEKAQITKETGQVARDYYGDGPLGIGAQVATEAVSSFWEAAKDPASIPEFVAQQIPQLMVMGKVGRAAEMAAQGAAKMAPKLVATKAGEKILENSATAGAVGFGATLQGIDVGSDTQQRLMKQPQELWDKNPEYKVLAAEIGPDAAKEAIASQLASEATLKGAAASVLSSMLPGGTSIEKALVGKAGSLSSLKAAGKGFKGEAVQEGIEEGSGKYFGNTAVQEINSKQESFEGVGAAAGQGAFMGGILGGGISGANAILSNRDAIGSEKREKEAAKLNIVKEAVASGDTSKLTDLKSPDYAPDIAIAALSANSQKEGTTPEAKQANLEKASQIITDLETRKETLQSQLEGASANVLQQQIKAVEQRAASLDPADTVAIAENQELLGMLQERLTNAATETKNVTAEISKVDSLIGSANKVLQSFVVNSQDKNLNVEEEAAKITSADPVASQTSADKIITLAMAVPDRVDPALAASLAADTTNGISDTQRAFLRTFSEARVAENELKNLGKVSQEIYYGSSEGAIGTKYYGLAKYRTDMSTALATNNKKAADYALSLLTNFEAGHQEKAATAAEALELFKKDGIQRRIQSLGNGKWEIKEGYFESDAERRKNGGLNISSNAVKLVTNVQKEAAAISKIAAELTTAYGIKFNGAANVQNVSQAPQGNQTNQTAVPSATAETTTPATTAAVPVGGGTTASIQTTEPTQTTDVDIAVNLMNTDDVFNQWSNTGTDRDTFVGLITSAFNTYKGKVTETNKAEAEKEISKSHKWFRAANQDQRDQFINLLIKKESNVTQAEETVTPATGSEETTTSSEVVPEVELTAELVYSEAQRTEMQKDLKRLTRLFNKVKRKNPRNLWNVVKRRMNESDLFDTYGDDWRKHYTLLKGNRSELDILSVDEFLDPTSTLDQVEQIKELLRNRQYLTYETRMELEILGVQIQELEQQLTVEDIQNEISYAEAELTEQGKPVEEPAESTSQEPTGNPTAPSAEEVAEEVEIPDEVEVAPVDEIKTGQLQAIQETTPEGTPHDEKKLGDFFTQSLGKETDASKRPLVAVKDFMQVWSERVNEFLKNGVSTDAQKRTLNAFKSIFDTWASKIDLNLKPGTNEKYNYTDPMRYLVQNKDGKVFTEENVKAAMFAGMFSYIADQSGRSAINDSEAINSILGRPVDEPVSPLAMRELSLAGTYQSQVVDTIGLAVMDALGLKLRKNAPQDMGSKLRMGLGAHVLKLMEDEGLLQRTEISNSKMAAMREEDFTDTLDRKGHIFFKLTRTEDLKLSNRVQKFVDAMKESQSVLQNLFGIEPALQFPSLTIPKGQQKTSDTGMGIPGLIRRVFKKNQERPWKINRDPVKILSFFTEDEAIEMAGVNDNIDFIHQRNQNSHKAKNDGLKREYQNFMQFLGELIVPSEKGMDQEFYLQQEMWKQQRSGYTTNAVNPNTSKIVRWLIAPAAWITKIPLNDQAKVDQFLIRLSEGFGVKPEKADSQIAITTVKDLMAKPEMQAAIKATQLMLTGSEISADQKQDFMNAVAKGKQKFHTVAALIAYAHYQQAIDSKADSFTTNLMAEVDGVSNGSVLNSVLYGVATTGSVLNKFMEKGGIYSIGSKFRKYNLWRGTPGHQDIYESNAVDLERAVRTKFPNNPIVAAIWNIAGKPIDAKNEATKDGRDLLKGPINPLNYGGGFKSILRKMSYDFVEKFYDKIQDTAKNDGSFNAFLPSVNTILEAAGQPTIPLDNDAAYYLSFTLTPRQEKALADAYSSTIGETVKEVIGSNFEAFLARSKEVTKTVNTAFEVYNAIYQVARQAMITELGIPIKNGEPIHDLSNEQEQELAERLKGILPVMHTAMSKQDNKTNNGILLSKKERKQNNSSTYKMVVGFNPAFPLKNGFKQLTVAGRSTELESPGVLSISGTTHALDSSISHTTQENRHVLNNHDALGDGVGTLDKTATELNQNTWKSLLNYSPMGEAYNALIRVIHGVVAMEAAGMLTPEMKTALKNQFGKAATLDEALSNMFNSAYHADRVKLEAMSQWAVVDQYAMDGGSYEVTDKDRKEAADRLSALSANQSQENLVAFVNFSKAVFGTPIPKTTPVQKQAPAPIPVVSPLGELGTPSIRSDPRLVAFFQANPNAIAEDVFVWLETEPSITSGLNNTLLSAIIKAVSSDLKIRFITPNTPIESILGKPVTNARGWTTLQGNKAEIYLLSPDFINSGLTLELLMHELIHAAIARIIDDPSPQAKVLVAELETLLAKAKEYAQTNNITGFDAALSGTQELVSWGMTNEAFQTKVLGKFQMESKTKGNVLVTGMKAFIDLITRFLGRKNNAEINDGVTTLIQNVSGLFAEAAQNQNKGGSNLSLAMEASQQIDRYTTREIHQALNDGSVTPAFQDRLGDLLDGMVQRLHGPFGAFAEQMRKTEANTPLEVWIKAEELGVAPFASEVLATFGASQQEAFAIEQVEATVRTALEGNDTHSKMAYRTLYKLYTETYKRLNKDGREFFKGDWSQATSDEKKAAKAKYNFIFDIASNPDGRSDYLTRFAALGLAHEGFNEMLQIATESNINSALLNETIIQKIQRWYMALLDMLQNQITSTYAGQRADQKMSRLVSQLVDIEAKKRTMLKERETAINLLAPVENFASDLAEGARRKIGEFSDSDFMKRRTNGIVKGINAMVSTVANDRVSLYMQTAQDFYEKHVTAQGSVLVSLLKEITGHKEKLQAALRAIKKFEGDRKDQITTFTKQARNAFIKKHSKETNAALTSTILRTGLHYLSDQYSLVELENLIDNSIAQDQAIAELEKQLGSMKAVYVTQIKGLAYYRATERTKVEVLMMNARLISRMSNTRYEGNISPAEAKQAEPIIKKLVSLYALKYTPKGDQALVKEVFRTENARGEAVGNGVAFLLQAHKALETEALDRQFRNNPIQMIHGFTPEILNPHTQFEVAGAKRGQVLMDYGYSKGVAVEKDPIDPDRVGKKLYLVKGAGLIPRVSGALLFKSNKAKGTAEHDGFTGSNTEQGIQNAQVQAVFDKKLRSAINTDPNWDPRMEPNSYSAPLYNEKGKVVNWRYLMNSDTKNDLLQRNNSFDQVLGVLAGSVFSKPRIKEQNKAVLESLKQVYDEDTAHANEYVLVGPDSNNAEFRELWALLPHDTQQDVIDVWGSKGIYVKPDSFDLIFGYRKRSITEPLIQKEKNRIKVARGGVLSKEEEQSFIAESYVWAVEWALHTYARVKLGLRDEEAWRYTKRAIVYAKRSERAWQELVRETKTIYVIKNISTMVGNNLSNLSQLIVSGVSLNEIRQHYPMAIRAATNYSSDMDELRELENQIKTGYTQGNNTDIERQIIRLKDSIARNPARELIEAGLMPTIVEDVAEDEDLFSYKTELTRKTEKYTNKLNPRIRRGVKFVYMTKDQKLFQALHRATQLGDFVARYVQYHHLINRQNKPMSKADAIHRVSEDFVNYDIQMHRNIQFMDDMGLFMFTKYFLRMQRILLRMGREHPARMLLLAAANSYLNLGSNVLNSSALSHIGNNPFGLGALGFPGALDELATVKAAMALVK